MSVLLARAGNKLLDIESGMIVPLDATEAEMRGKIKTLSQDRFVERVFPAHYPTNEKLYYAGFETLILKNPAQVVVLGIEDGPASRAGIHWEIRFYPSMVLIRAISRLPISKNCLAVITLPR